MFLRAGPWPAREVRRAEETQGPGVKPFIPDATGPSECNRAVTVMIIAQRLIRRRGRWHRDA